MWHAAGFKVGQWKFENGTILNLDFLSSILRQDCIDSVRGAGGERVSCMPVQHFVFWCHSVCMLLYVWVRFVFLAICHASEANGVLMVA